MKFKTIITDVNALGVAIDKVNAVMKAQTSLNVMDYSLFGTALDGLSAKQVALALSTQKLSEAQLEEIVVKNNLISKYGVEELIKTGLLSANSSLLASEKAVNAEKLQESILEKALNKEKAEDFIQTQLEITSDGEEIASTTILNKALMDEMVKRDILSEEKANEILQSFGVVTADVAETASKEALTTATWAQVKAQLALMASNPMTWIMAIGAVIYGIVKEVEYFTGSTERAMESLEETSQAFDDTTSELESLNDELKTTTDRIKELEKFKKSGKISVADEEELKTLKEQNKELQRQIVLKRQDQVEDAKDVLDDLDEADLTVESRYDTFTVQGVVYGNMVTRAEEANNALKGYNKLLEERKDLVEEEGELVKQQESGDFTTEDTDRLASIRSRIEVIDTSLEDTESYIGELYNEDAQKKLSAYESLIDAGVELDSTQQAEYDSLKELEDAYLLHCYRIQNTESAYKALNAEQQKSILLDKLKEKGYTDKQAHTIISSINEDDLDDYYTADFDFDLPNIDDYKGDLDKWAKDFVATWANHVTQETDGTSLSFTDTFTLEDESGNATALSTLKDQLSEVESAYNTCLSAKEEYDEQGYLSVSTLQSVLALGDEYLQYLFDEEGNIRLDAEAFQDLTQARINDMEAQALSTLAENIKQITDEATAAEYLAQKQDELADSYTDVAAGALFAMSSIDGFSDSETLQNAYNSFVTQYEQIKSLFADTRQGLSSAYDGNSDTSSGGSSTDPLIDAFQAEYNNLKHYLEMDYITEKQYYDSLDALNKKYFAGKHEYLDEYRQYEEEVYQGLKSYYKETVENQMSLLESQLNAGRIAYTQYTSTVGKLLADMFKQGKISAEDYFNYVQTKLNMQIDIYQSALSAIVKCLDDEIEKWEEKVSTIEEANDKLQDQLDNYDSILSAIQDLFDSEKDKIQDKIDALEDENDNLEELVSNYDSVLSVVEKVYDKEIKALEAEQQAIQDKIDAINDEADAHKRALAIEEARWALQKAQTQRTKKLYAGEGKGYIYTTDRDEIREAQQTLQDLETEEIIEGLEKEKDALQDQIDVLEEWKAKWQEVSESYQNAVDEQIAISILGQQYESLILSNRIEDIEAFKNKYVTAQKKIDDNTGMIDSYNEKIDCYDKLAEKWSSLSTAREESINRHLAAEEFGKNWEAIILADRVGTFDHFSSKYVSLQSKMENNENLINSYNEKISYYEALKEQWNEITDAYDDAVNAQYAKQLLGANWEKTVLSGRINTITDFKNQYVSLQQQLADAIVSANQAIIDSNKDVQNSQKLISTTSGPGDLGDDPPTITEKYSVVDYDTKQVYLKDATQSICLGYMHSNNLTVVGMSGTSYIVKKAATYGGGGKYLLARYASGTDHAKKGLNLVGEEGTETFIDNEGNVSLVTAPTLIPMEGGETVKNAKETKSLFNPNNLVPVKTLAFDGIDGEMISATPNEFQQKILSAMPSYASMVKMPDFNSQRYDFTPVSNYTETTPVVQNITLTLPNVTNNSGYERIRRELKQMQIDAYQTAHKR